MLGAEIDTRLYEVSGGTTGPKAAYENGRVTVSGGRANISVEDLESTRCVISWSHGKVSFL
jgi:hypothetical protein